MNHLNKGELHMKLLKNGRLFVDGKLSQLDMLFDETGIVKLEENIEPQESFEVIDAKGNMVLPGLIDVHVHLREPGFTQKETILTGSKAAAHGGFTTIMAMPNVKPYPDNVETMKAYLDKIHSDAVVNVIPYACITRAEASKELADFKGLSEMGIHAYSDDGVGVNTQDMMREAMKVCKENDGMIVAHTEDMSYRRPKACMHEGIRNKELGLLGIPSACEYAQFKRDLDLAKETGCRYHVCHMSAKESVAYLKEYKAMGVDCSGEVTAHHLLLNEMDVVNENHKMNPPLRSKEDQQSLINGLLDGTIDMIANDHAPHTEEEKQRGMELAPFGIVSLETAFPLLYTRFVEKEHVFTLAQLVHWMSEAPAKRFRIAKKGALAVGNDADFIIVDTEHYRKVDKTKFYSKGKNTPFDGINATGWVLQTFCQGNNVFTLNEEEHA